MATGSQGKQASLFKQRAEPKSLRRVECPHYSPIPDSRRCRHYLTNGGCGRPDELMCREWLKKNGHAVTAGQDQAAEPAKNPPVAGSRPSREHDLQGRPVPENARARNASPARAGAACRLDLPEVDPEQQPPPPGLTPEDIASFKDLGVEVCLRSEKVGELWLVAEYTCADRKEITPEHAATLHHLLQVFPGSQVVSFDKNPRPDKESNP